MPRNKITDLRNHLFEIIEELKDPESEMTIEKAQAIANVAGVIIETAKVEVQFLKAIKDSGQPLTGFMEEKKLLGASEAQVKSEFS